MTHYVITMTPETSAITCQALELYARVMYGQMGRVVDAVADGIPAKKWEQMDAGEDREEAFCTWLRRKRDAKEYVNKARFELFPEFPQSNTSYGVGSYRDADIAWQTYEAIRYAMAWTEHPEGGSNVDFNRPIRWADEPLPTVEVRSDPEDGELHAQTDNR